ncbi:hypothetical protein KIW84_070672 [Lathyrus oleraceus]|uniref:Uncharacterized protein n=1 Tax=Pisum sativum TaxID=3888 RepID=A0A9D4VIL1_PEA|nr:hypothetical protein KIW84_070672 [Pisum sativum]
MPGKELLRGRLKDGLYHLSGSDNQSNDPCAYISIKESWHRKLEHPNNKVTISLTKAISVSTLMEESLSQDMLCSMRITSLFVVASSLQKGDDNLSPTNEKKATVSQDNISPAASIDTQQQLNIQDEGDSINVKENNIETMASNKYTIETSNNNNQINIDINDQHEAKATHKMCTRSKTSIYKPKLPYIGLIES